MAIEFKKHINSQGNPLPVKAARIKAFNKKYARKIKELEDLIREEGNLGQNETIYLGIKNKEMFRYRSENNLESVEEIREFIQQVIDLGGHSKATMRGLNFLHKNAHRTVTWWHNSERRDLVPHFGSVNSCLQRHGLKAMIVPNKHPAKRAFEICIGKIVKV